MEYFNRSFARFYSNIIGVITLIGYVFVILIPLWAYFTSHSHPMNVSGWQMIGSWLVGIVFWTLIVGIQVQLCAMFQIMDGQVPAEKKKRKKLQWVDVD